MTLVDTTATDQIVDQPQHQILSIDFSAAITPSMLPRVREELGYATFPTVRARTARHPLVVHLYESGAWGHTWLLIFRLAEDSWRALIVSDRATPPPSETVQMWTLQVHKALKLFKAEITSSVSV